MLVVLTSTGTVSGAGQKVIIQMEQYENRHPFYKSGGTLEGNFSCFKHYKIWFYTIFCSVGKGDLSYLQTQTVAILWNG